MALGCTYFDKHLNETMQCVYDFSKENWEPIFTFFIITGIIFYVPIMTSIIYERLKKKRGEAL